MKEKNRHIFIIDDDTSYTDLLPNYLEKLGQVEKAYSVEDFFSQFTPFSYDLILLDLKLKKGKEGLKILKYIKEEDPNAIVVVISAYGDIATAVEALHMGAKTFLEKDKNPPKEIALICEHLLKELETERQLKELLEKEKITEIIGNDPKIALIKKQISFAAQEGFTLLLKGETGVGKHHIAKVIHSIGKRKGGPFVVFNPLGLSEDEVQKELFSKDLPGAIYRAHKGILVIGDVAQLPLLAKYFIGLLEKRFGTKKLSDEASKILMNYSFPGNVAELKAAIETAFLRAHAEGSDIITARHLPIPSSEEDVHFHITGKVRDIQKFLAEVELYLVDRALREANWKKWVAGKQLGYSSRFSMLKRVKRHFEKYPELKNKFRELATAYKIL